MLELLQVLTLPEMALCALIVFVAAILQMSVGMGFGMLASPLIALVKPDLVPGSIMIMGLVVAFSGAWRERHFIAASELKLGIGGRVVGSGMAFIVLASLSGIEAFLIFFGFVMLFAVILTGSGLRIGFNHQNLFVLSIVSGVMGTITAVGAPPMALIYHNRPAEVVRPTLNAFFGSGAVLGLVSLAASGWLGVSDLFAALALLPAMLLGILASRLFKSMPSPLLSVFLLTLSGIASVVLIFRGFGVIT